MTTTELIEILKKNEFGGISRKPREIGLTVNGRYMPHPEITLSSTGDGIAGPEIDLDVDGEMYEEEARVTTHELKIYCNFANEIVDGNKAFEIRENDRGFQKGDRVKFKVLDMSGLSFPSHKLCEKTYEITYVLSGWGLKNGYVVFGIKEIK